MKTEIPQFFEKVVDMDVRKRDLESKRKMKYYHDRNAAESVLKKGDLVLLKQKRSNKLSTRFEDKNYVVVEKKGNAVKIRSETGEE